MYEMKVTGVDHIGIAVKSIDEALKLWEEVLGIKCTGREEVEAVSYTHLDVYKRQEVQYVAEIIPSTMIFVPSKGGHSRCELEFTPLEDSWRGINVLIQTVLE